MTRKIQTKEAKFLRYLQDLRRRRVKKFTSNTIAFDLKLIPNEVANFLRCTKGVRSVPYITKNGNEKHIGQYEFEPGVKLEYPANF
jgi:glutaredoxin